MQEHKLVATLPQSSLPMLMLRAMTPMGAIMSCLGFKAALHLRCLLILPLRTLQSFHTPL